MIARSPPHPQDDDAGWLDHTRTLREQGVTDDTILVRTPTANAEFAGSEKEILLLGPIRGQERPGADHPPLRPGSCSLSLFRIFLP